MISPLVVWLTIWLCSAATQALLACTTARHSLIEAALPKLLFGQVPTIQRRTDIPGSTTDSRIEHLGTLFGVRVQVTVADDLCMRLRWLGGGWFSKQ
jgi:hypothetical protein